MTRALAFFALALSCACAASSKTTDASLPFHVAVIPFVEGTAPHSVDGELSLALDAELVTRAALREIQRECFTRATLLALPRDVSPATFAAWAQEERDSHWIQAAEEACADLLLECELKYERGVRGRTNEKFWLNLPLFAFGGPLCYFVDDRTYEGSARLRAALHDLNPILEGRASLADGRSRLADVTPRFERTQLDFLERNGGKTSRFLASLVIPAGFLARHGEHVERGIAQRVEEQLAERLATELLESRADVVEAPRVCAFYLEAPPTARLEAGEVHVETGVLLRIGQVERMDTWRLVHGVHEVEGYFDEGLPAPELSTQRESFVRYPFTATLPHDPSATHVRLELVAGGREPVARTFTLDVR